MGARSFEDDDAGAHHATGKFAQAVQRNLQVAAVAASIKQKLDNLALENAMLEEILSEPHHMVTNADLSTIMSMALTQQAGGGSAILAARKPPQLAYVRRRVAGNANSSGRSSAATPQPNAAVTSAPTPATRIVAAISSSSNTSLPQILSGVRGLLVNPSAGVTTPSVGNTAKINYRILLEEQRALHEGQLEERRAYDRMMSDFVRRQKRLETAFT